MANEETKIDPLTPEEQKAEAEAQTVAKEEEIRAAVITEFGFDEVDDADKIDKAVKKEVAHRTKLSEAIGQKIKYRTLAQGKKEEPKPEVKPSQVTAEEIDERVSKGVNSVLEQRDLNEMSHSEEIKAEIKRVAEIRKITVKQAEKDPYIVSRIEEDKKAQKAEDASLSNKANKGTSKKNWSVDVPPDVDMTTEEGRKTYDEWKVWAVGQGA